MVQMVYCSIPLCGRLLVINIILSWLRVRSDNLTRAQKALDDAHQIIEAQAITIQMQQELSEHSQLINKELVDLLDLEASDV